MCIRDSREDEFEELLCFADHIVFNSPSQLLRFGKRAKQVGKSVGLRINPECSTQEAVSYTHLDVYKRQVSESKVFVVSNIISSHR